MGECNINVLWNLKVIKDGDYWKVGTSTFVVEERKYPHDEGCEGFMCWCHSRAKHKQTEVSGK